MKSRSALRRKVLVGLLFLAVAGLFPVVVRAQPTLTVRVRCCLGQTIARALQQGDERKPLVVVVAGTCSENVVIDRADVTLIADPAGGMVNGPDPTADTIRVLADRVTIEGITVMGGRTGIAGAGAGGLIVRNCLVQQTGLTGIALIQGGSGTIDGCTVQDNPGVGVVIGAAAGTVINSLITQNGQSGIVVTDGGSGRIGLTALNALAGNTISNNGSNGVTLLLGSAAFLAGNTISGNGTNPALGRVGIGVFNATAHIIGGNSITGNAGHGIAGRSASLVVGDPIFGLPIVNNINGNGTAGFGGGIFGFVGTSLLIRNATISGNNGFGLILSLRSSAEISGNTIQNTIGPAPNGDGIRLVFGSGLFIDPPPAQPNTVVGNAGFGVNCTDGESSLVNTGLVVLGPPPNALGGVSVACTAF